MNKLYAKIAAGAATAILMGAMFAPSVFAGGGDKGGSKTTIINTTICSVDQSSRTNVGTLVLSAALTGGNKAAKNVAIGGVTVKSGNAKSTTSVTVSGGSNIATDPCCGCKVTTPENLTVGDNEDKPKEGTVTVVNFQGTFIDQSSSTNVLTGIVSVAGTGGNSAEYNVGGPVSVTSGNATSKVTISVTGGSNIIN
jgi:hypothetical protein